MTAGVGNGSLLSNKGRPYFAGEGVPAVNRRHLLAAMALTVPTAGHGQQWRPGFAPGFRPGFQFLTGVPDWVISDSTVFRNFIGNRGWKGETLASSTEGLSVSRASTGYDLRATTLFAANTPRRTAAGLLIEPAATNLMTQSAFQGGSSNWQPDSGNTALKSNAAAGPDGSSTLASIFAATIAGAAHNVMRMSGSFPVGSPFTASVIMRASPNPGYIQINTQGGSLIAAVAYFDLTGLGIAIVGSNLAGSGETNKSASILSLGNGFYRCTFTFTPNAATTGVGVYVGPANPGITGGGDQRAYTGIIGQGIFAWGVDVKLGLADRSSYVPSSSSAGVRAADTVTETLPAGTSKVELLYDNGMVMTLDAVPGRFTYPPNPNGTTLWQMRAYP